ncbi:anti-sigma 24 factor [Azoarcus sp. DD4]|uniref:sigma-E factor negative regulatory protein n=1 Tax=Azoarcus sp. DD4 TaxID=2027405 RepID=UPI00112789C1|nr:sigma-E factor negative regulatory protein [Azoarcus sp. DD4]QDF96861.1 anti-sigma 24 factor [Azoarcus sp. DD4]
MKEKLSALLDGDLEEHSVRTTLEGLRRDGDLRKEWEAYCLIGDVLRGECHGAPDFVTKVMSSLEDEPVVLAPAAIETGGRRTLWQSLLPIAASVMGVAAVGWVASALYSGEEAAAPVVSVQRIANTAIASAAKPVAPVATAVPGGQAAAAVEDAHREYVFAHQAMTAGGPIPGAVQYVRTVSDTRQDSRP